MFGKIAGRKIIQEKDSSSARYYKLAGSQTIKPIVFSSHLAVLYTHRLSAGPLTPALPQHRTDVTQPGGQLRPADLGERSPRLHAQHILINRN